MRISPATNLQTSPAAATHKTGPSARAAKAQASAPASRVAGADKPTAFDNQRHSAAAWLTPANIASSVVCAVGALAGFVWPHALLAVGSVSFFLLALTRWWFAAPNHHGGAAPSNAQKPASTAPKTRAAPSPAVGAPSPVAAPRAPLSPPVKAASVATMTPPVVATPPRPDSPPPLELAAPEEQRAKTASAPREALRAEQGAQTDDLVRIEALPPHDARPIALSLEDELQQMPAPSSVPPSPADDSLRRTARKQRRALRSLMDDFLQEERAHQRTREQAAVDAAQWEQERAHLLASGAADATAQADAQRLLAQSAQALHAAVRERDEARAELVAAQARHAEAELALDLLRHTQQQSASGRAQASQRIGALERELRALQLSIGEQQTAHTALLRQFGEQKRRFAAYRQQMEPALQLETARADEAWQVTRAREQQLDQRLADAMTKL